MRISPFLGVAIAALSACTVTTEYQRRGVEDPLPATVSVEDLEHATTAAEAVRLDLEARSIEQFKNPDFSLAIIEVDDRGNTNPTQYKQAMDHVEEALCDGDRHKGSLLITFVHGWHHNCATCDGNLSCFRRLLSELRRRELLPGGMGRQVVGVYVGWRGRAFSGLPDYASIWNRKWRAEDIGHRAGKEILSDLRGLWQEHTCMMVSIGHSLGGGFLLAAIQGTLTGNAGDLVRRGAPFRSIVRAQGSRASARPGVKALRARFGDLVVLLNPAIEAHQYDVFDRDRQGAVESEKNATYDPQQLPILITIASEADWPNRRLFPASRGIAAVDLLHHVDIWGRSSELLALGHYAPQITHELRYKKEPASTAEASQTSPDKIPLVPPLCTCDVEWEQLPVRREGSTPAKQHAKSTAELLSDPSSDDFTDPNLVLKVTSGRRWDTHTPYMVIKTDASMIEDHDDIFNPRVVGFLADVFDTYWKDKERVGWTAKKGF